MNFSKQNVLIVEDDIETLEIMTEVFVIEKMIAPGIWELLSNKAYKNERNALDDCEHIIKYMQYSKLFANP